MSNFEYPSYEGALKAAGGIVLEFAQFGSFQGDWFALVKVNNNRILVGGSYGSCSGCDALQSEFDYDYDAPDFPLKYSEFGKRYLENPLDVDLNINKFTEQMEWDQEAEDVLKFLIEVKKQMFYNKLEKELNNE